MTLGRLNGENDFRTAVAVFTYNHANGEVQQKIINRVERDVK